MNIDVGYGITRRLSNLDLAAARERVITALAAEGFGILTEIDVKKTLEKKLGVAIDPYVILGACNPKLAHAALSVDPGVGLLLPCNVVLTKDGDDVVVSALAPKEMFAAAGAAKGLGPIAEEADARIRRAVAAA